MSGWHSKGIQRPHIWCTGPDPVRHDQFVCWMKSKAQCNFRGEEFSLTFEQYEEVWAGQWSKRGRTPNDVCMTRIDWDGAWESGNVEIITRAEHFTRAGLYRRQRMIDNISRGRGMSQPKTKRKLNEIAYVKKVQK